jgi:tRNA(Ile)-lysidine synthetase-like protein
MIDIIKKNTASKKSIISLSGGVDSMVLSYILKYIGIDIIAVHINYNNRPECEEECNILKQWCNMLDIKLYIRKITEIQRPEMMELNMRDLYETYTRDIRFNTYMNVNPDYDNIFLGHNHDDQFENIFTNIVSESHFDNLRGMTYQTQLKFKDKFLNFVRPMLDIPKEQIYKFASYFSIPHFKDSTPKWSQRGKIRDIVKPTLINWNPVIIDSFFKLSTELGIYVDFIKQIAQISSDSIKKYGELKLNINNICFLESYWIFVFRDNNIWITTKSNQNFIAKLQYIKSKFEKLELNNLEKINLCKDKQIKWKKINTTEIILNFN